MDRESFANYLDSSWLDFRQRLLAVYPESSGGFEHNGRLISTGSSDDNEVGGAMMRNLDGTPVVLKQEYENAGFLTSNGSNLSCMSLSEDEQEPTTNEGARNQDSSHLINSALADFTAKEVESVRNRLRLRLGAVSSNHLVSGKSLLEAVQSLGLTKYSEEDMNGMVNQLADFINLRFEAPRKKRNSGISNGIVNGLFKQPNPKELGKPIWEYPQDVIPQKRTSSVSVSVSRTVLQRSESSMRSKGQYNVVPARALVDCFLADDEEAMKKIFTAKYINQYLSMREILLAGDTNRLVAELTFVRINDLAAPPEPVHPLTYIEPIVALLIVGNGVMIGFQTDPCCEDLSVWPYIELAFALLLVIEILLRVHLLRCRQYWCGQDKFWNWFDLFLVGVGIADLTLQWVGTESDVQGTSLLRFCRLIRLVRIVKVFRIRVMRDLRLMVKGLIAGIRTLCLAFILLFTVLYVISGFATMTIGNNPKAEALDVDKYFKNIPASMFTAFRCFTGECVNREGQPIHEMLAEAFQLPFIIGYVACYMLVTMGIFNVILAVYVDITMKAAKENDAVTAEQYARESIRIARTTRELLKKFSLAHHVYHVNDGEEREEEDWEDSTKAKLAKMKTTNVFAEDGGHDKIAITKELFLLVVQDPSVQALMDELDLPPDRANLFEIIDADGSGTLQITELLHGLLKIRGEINKSDAVASLLATRAVQNQVQEFEEKVAEDLEQIRAQMTQLAQRERFPFRMSLGVGTNKLVTILESSRGISGFTGTSW
ncbi:unnamed protein product [Durusdinium trenchii]|uniref:Ion transport domain-containing protein n=1 Tax=Durusdinium trenchii TaxID=1381693 RepID=A0ABP0RKM7_9DINO